MTTIIVTHEDNEVDEFEFESTHEVISIGRRSDNDVAIPNLSISGKHARICLEDGKAFLEDLNSTNGTYVNGEVVKRRSVHSGDDIILGKIRLGVILSAVENAVAADTDFEEAEEQSAKAHDDSMDFSSDKLAGIPDPSEPDEMSFDEDARLFAQSTGESDDVDVDDVDVNDDVIEAGEHSSDEIAEISAQQPEEAMGQAEMPAIASFNSNNAPHPLDGIDSKALNGDDNAPPMHELDSAPAKSKGAVIEIKNGAKSGQILPIDKPVTTLGRPGIQIAAIMRKPDGYFLMHIESDDSVDRPTLNQDAIGDEPVLLHSGDELNVAGIDVEFMLS